MAQISVYRLDPRTSEIASTEKSDLVCKTWVPGINAFIPPGKGMRYLIYWFFHYLHIFKNKGYSASLILENEKLIASLLIVPSYFKWPFMLKQDVQFTYVMTDPGHRGKGIGEMMIRETIRNLKDITGSIWYITDTDNTASIRLCTKVGFKFVSNARSGKYLRILSLTDRVSVT